MRRGIKAFKKLIVIALCGTMLMLPGFDASNDSKAAWSWGMTFTARKADNGVQLNWSVSDEKIYRVSRKADGESNFTPVGDYSGIMDQTKRIRDRNDTATINVLPVVPNNIRKNYLNDLFTSWNGTNALTDYNINVLTPVTFDDFNENRDNAQNEYLYATDRAKVGRYPAVNVDVIIFGTADTNGQADLSEKARQSVSYYIKNNNGGVIFAHDTIALGDDPSKWGEWSRFWKLAKDDGAGLYLLKPFEGYWKNNTKATDDNNCSNMSTYIVPVKQGLLTSMPININSGTALANYYAPNGYFTIKKSHNTGQEANEAGDRWFAFYGSEKPTASSNWDPYGMNDATNFYLTTKKHTGMIQIGHTTTADSLRVQATTAEKMILINLIHYVAYQKSVNSYSDKDAVDKAAPTCTVKAGSIANGSLRIDINAEDKGTSYTYQIEEFNRDDDVTKASYSSAAVSDPVEIKSGLKQCMFLVNGNETVNENNPKFETLTHFNTSTGEGHIDWNISKENQYVHIKIVDNNDNSYITTYKIAKDDSKPIIMVNEKDVTDSVIDEKDLDNLDVKDMTADDMQLDSGIAGYAFTKTDDSEPTAYVDDKKEIDFHKYGSGYRWLWVKDNVGNVSKVKIHIHSDLIYVDPETGEHIEINDVIYDGVTMDQYYYGDKKIFF